MNDFKTLRWIFPQGLLGYRLKPKPRATQLMGLSKTECPYAWGGRRLQVGRWRQLSACVGLYYRRHQIALRSYVLPTFRMVR